MNSVPERSRTRLELPGWSRRCRRRKYEAKTTRGLAKQPARPVSVSAGIKLSSSLLLSVPQEAVRHFTL